MLFQKIQKILNLDIRKTSALKTRMRMRMRMSKKCGTSADADADIRPIPNCDAWDWVEKFGLLEHRENFISIFIL